MTSSLKLTLYDWIGYLVPGSILIWSIYYLTNYLGLNHQIIFLENANFLLQGIFILILSYFIGHLLHSIANISIDKLPSGSYPTSNYFENYFLKDFPSLERNKLYRLLSSDLMKEITTESKTTDLEIINLVKSSYWYCYNIVVTMKEIPLTQIFLTFSGLYRGLCIVCIINFLIYLITFFVKGEFFLLVIAIMSVLIWGLFQMRLNRFKRYLTKSVYIEYLILKSK